MSENETSAAMAKLAGASVAAAKKMGYTLDHSEESIAVLEEYVSDIHQFLKSPECEWTENMKWGVAIQIGGYLGEIIRRVHGGDWQPAAKGPDLVGYNPALVVGSVTMTPVAKVIKRFDDGISDHLGQYYATAGTLITASKVEDGKSKDDRKPWWRFW
jgi:hypothetical protein